MADKLLLRKRALIETITSQIENRSPVNFMVNLLCGLIAYCHQEKRATTPIAGRLTRITLCWHFIRHRRAPKQAEHSPTLFYLRRWLAV